MRFSGASAREVDLLAGLRRIGLDGISHRTGRRSRTVVVCHDSGRPVWADAGRDRATVERFLDRLRQERCKQTELVCCDMASWIGGPIREHCPQAEVCLDPFHVARHRRAGRAASGSRLSSVRQQRVETQSRP